MKPYEPYKFIWTDAPTEISRKEAKDCFPLILAEIPKRFAVVLEQIGMTEREALANPELAFTRCGIWQRGQTELSLYSREDLEAIKEVHSKVVPNFEPDPFVPSARSFRVAYDVGFFYGEMLVKSSENVHWDVCLGPKNSIDLHLPVVSSDIINYAFSPIGPALTMAYLYMEDGNSTRNLYEPFRIELDWLAGKNLLRDI